MDEAMRQRIRTTPPHAIRTWPLPRTDSPTIVALREELDRTGPDGRGAIIKAFRARLAREGTPLVEPDGADRSLVTFVWFGPAPHGVVLQLGRITDPLDPADTLLEPVAGADVHALTLRLPADWQGSYLFVVLPEPVRPTLHGPVDRRVLMALALHAEADPLAREPLPSKPVAASAGLPVPDAAAARGHAAARTALWLDEPVPTRHIASIARPATGASLDLHHWATPGADAASRVVLLTDGEVWREQFPLTAALTDRTDGVPPLHVLFLDSGGPVQREADDAGDAATTGALLADLRRAAAGVVPEAPWTIAGQSFGGLFALLCAVRHPELVRSAVAQSPSLWWPSSPSPWTSEPGWFEEAGAALARPAPVVLEAGTIDTGVVRPARAAAALLRARGSLVDYREHRCGHDVLQWQTTLPELLRVALAHDGPPRD